MWQVGRALSLFITRAIDLMPKLSLSINSKITSSGPWTPAVLATAPYFWGNTQSTVSQGGASVSVNDLSGNANHLILPSGTGKGYPSQSSSGQPIVFDGENDVLVTTSTASFANPAGWIFLLVKSLAFVAAGRLISTPSIAAPNNLRIRRGSSTVIFFDYAGSGYNANIGIETSLLGFRMGVSTHTYVNGSLVFGGYNSVTPVSIPGLVVGGYPVSSSVSEPLNFELYEMVAVPYDVPTTDRQKIEGYMCHNNNLASLLPDGHPYKNSAP